MKEFGKGGEKRPPHAYGRLAASADPVALDSVIARAMGYRAGEVLHLTQAAARGLGVADVERVRVIGERQTLDFGPLHLPKSHWYLNVPAWLSAPISRTIKVYPRLAAAACAGYGACAEVCPEGAITPQRNWLARLVGVGG